MGKTIHKNKGELTSILGNNIVEIHHVGSTAIKGIVAKPILDAAVVIKNIESLNILGMETVGYDYCGEHGEHGRYLFVKRRDSNISTHHIHCYLGKKGNLINTVMFCRFLNEHPNYAKQYNDLKLELAQKYADDRIAYTDGKAEFITNMLSLAKNK